MLTPTHFKAAGTYKNQFSFTDEELDCLINCLKCVTAFLSATGDCNAVTSLYKRDLESYSHMKDARKRYKHD